MSFYTRDTRPVAYVMTNSGSVFPVILKDWCQFKYVNSRIQDLLKMLDLFRSNGDSCARTSTSNLLKPFVGNTVKLTLLTCYRLLLTFALLP